MSNFYHLKDLSSNFEDYLKTIGDLEASKGQVRSKEIAKIMKVKPSSVTNALQVLREQKLISYEPYGPIIMTSRGKRIWLIIHQKYKTVKDFFTEILEIDHKTADELACTMEHAISPQITERILLLRQFLKDDSTCGTDTIERLHDFFAKQTEKTEKEIGKEIPMFLLSVLKPGERATIHKINGDQALRQNFLDMGLSRGQEVIVERVAPLGDPIEITIRGYSLSLRKSEAELIIVM
ncbi:MAG: DtxR family transcriptional regulator [Spirochaetales bacterium]|nr:DtxR family transcriptional regulator [Spirochaetales bacterium]